MSVSRILIVEDEIGIAETVTYAIETSGMCSDWVSTGAEALEKLSEERYDLVVLDVGLPDCTGFEFARETLLPAGMPFLFLTARSDEVDRVVGLELGGDDYIVKPFSPRELVVRIKNIIRRTALVGRESLGIDGPVVNDTWQVDPGRRIIRFRGEPLDLSKSEFGILELLIRRPGQVFSREQLLDLLWETPEMSTERTVDSHIKNIRRKLREVDSSSEAIETHRGVGYALKESL